MTSGFSSQGIAEGPDGIPAWDSLNHRFAGQSVIEKLLTDRRNIPSRPFLSRVFGAGPLRPEDLSWYKGALGEIAVGEILKLLGPEWTVLHAVPVGAGTSDIDHVLIGPAGIFTINTKNHSGQPIWVAGQVLMVAGKKQRHIYNASYEATRAGQLLSKRSGQVVRVTGVIVLVSPKRLKIKQRPSSVVVIADRQLLRWLSHLPQVLSAREVVAVRAAAILPGTWHRGPIYVGDPAALALEFAALHGQVVSARRRRVGWIVVLIFGAPVVLATLSTFF